MSSTREHGEIRFEAADTADTSVTPAFRSPFLLMLIVTLRVFPMIFDGETMQLRYSNGILSVEGHFLTIEKSCFASYAN